MLALDTAKNVSCDLNSALFSVNGNELVTANLLEESGTNNDNDNNDNNNDNCEDQKQNYLFNNLPNVRRYSISY